MHDEIDIPDSSTLADPSVLRSVRDLSGLPVQDASGLCVGELFGALAEADTGLIRYLDLELSTLDRHVLVPIGHARVREQKEGPRIQLRAALLEELEQIPPLPADMGHITDPFERALLEAYGRTFHGELYYSHPAYDHSGLYAGEHVVVGEGDEATGPLMRLSYLPAWRVASGEPDIRGWPLVLDGDVHVEIQDLIVDTGAEKVRYVVVRTPDDAGARLVPVGFLRIETESRQVRAGGFTAEDISELPPYDGGGVTREHEDSVHAALRRRFSGRRRYLLPDFSAV
jgi:hypothetical protein